MHRKEINHIRDEGFMSRLCRVLKKCRGIGHPCRSEESRASEAYGSSPLNTDEWDRFYKAFEMKFRGEPEMITERLRSRYGELLRSQRVSASTAAEPLGLDLGCGHGEFLTVLRESGFRTLGLDQSGEAVNFCLSSGHHAERGDVLAYLEAQTQPQYDVISCLHVIEHCAPRYTHALLTAASRCLRPGGLLIVETPSLFSLWAGTRQFYLDPTHTFPVHPEYLSFLLEYCGLTEVVLRAYGEVEHPLRGSVGGLSFGGEDAWNQWFFGPMDMCCLGRKPEDSGAVR